MYVLANTFLKIIIIITLIVTPPPGIAGTSVVWTNLEISGVSFKAPVPGGM